MPLFPGCADTDKEALQACSNQKLLQFIYKNITFPESAKLKGTEGTVLVKFVVNKLGGIQNKEIQVTPGKELGDAVLDMLGIMGKEIRWLPGKQDGKKVNVEYTLPVKFKLQ